MKRVLSIFLLFTLVMSMVACGSQTTKDEITEDNKETKIIGSKKTLTSDLETILSRYIDEKVITGNIFITKGDEVLINKNVGMADIKNKISNSSTTKYQIGSLSKQFTAACIMILEDKGMLKVKDNISKYIPDYPNGEKITIHHLLTHTSGIPEHLDRVMENVTKLHTMEEIIAVFKDKPLVFKPGERFEYCNSNYVLLGHLIEKISGEEYGEFLNKNIFKPLQMNDTGYTLDLSSLDNMAIGYETISPEPQIAINMHPSVANAAGGIYSTSEDLNKWHKALMNNSIMNAEVTKKFMTPYVDEENDGKYGYGWEFKAPYFTDKSYKVIGHGGTTLAFVSEFYSDPVNDFNIVTLSNVPRNYDLKMYMELIDILKK